MKTYYRAPWPDIPVPEGEPSELLYEVDDQDSVPRLVEIYSDGSLLRDSIENDPGPWGDTPSLVQEEWSWVLDEAGIELRIVPREEFEALWEVATFKVHPR